MKETGGWLTLHQLVSLLVTFQHCVKKHCFQSCPKNNTCNRDQSIIHIRDICSYSKNIHKYESNEREREREIALDKKDMNKIVYLQ